MARLVAVDLHRNTLFVVMTDANGQELWHRRFPTTLGGEAALLEQRQVENAIVAIAGAV